MMIILIIVLWMYAATGFLRVLFSGFVYDETADLVASRVFGTILLVTATSAALLLTDTYL